MAVLLLLLLWHKLYDDTVCALRLPRGYGTARLREEGEEEEEEDGSVRLVYDKRPGQKRGDGGNRCDLVVPSMPVTLQREREREAARVLRPPPNIAQARHTHTHTGKGSSET